MTKFDENSNYYTRNIEDMLTEVARTSNDPGFLKLLSNTTFNVFVFKMLGKRSLIHLN